MRAIRRVVTGALEIERKEGRIGSSLEAAPKVYVADAELRAALRGVDLAEIAITSGIELRSREGPQRAFRLAEVPGVAVVFARAEGTKCARSWKILPEVGSDPSSRNSRRAMRLPCASSMHVTLRSRSSAMARNWLWGPVSALGLSVAAIVVLLDQANKAWMLYVYDIGARGTVTVTPFFDLVLVWNQGISYGLLPQEGCLVGSG